MNSNISKFAVLCGRVITLAITNRRGLRHLLGNALAESNAVADPETDVTSIPVLPVESLVKEVCTVTVSIFPQIESSISATEACALSVLLRQTQARRVFEFGTFRGVSTTQLVQNVVPEAEVFTLDLPSEGAATQFSIKESDELKLHKLREKGELIPSELWKRITFLAQDSALFDPKPYAGTMDFVFVDGAHTADYVRNDSEKAWTMLRKNGIVVWHDCRPESPAVAQFLLRSPYHPRRIAFTTLAFAVKS